MNTDSLRSTQMPAKIDPCCPLLICVHLWLLPHCTNVSCFDLDQFAVRFTGKIITAETGITGIEQENRGITTDCSVACFGLFFLCTTCSNS